MVVVAVVVVVLVLGVLVSKIQVRLAAVLATFEAKETGADSTAETTLTTSTELHGLFGSLGTRGIVLWLLHGHGAGVPGLLLSRLLLVGGLEETEDTVVKHVVDRK